MPPGESSKYDDIHKAVKQSILDYSEDKAVFRDFRSDTHSYPFDTEVDTFLNDNVVTFISWQDNEYSHSKRVVSLTAS